MAVLVRTPSITPGVPLVGLYSDTLQTAQTEDGNLTVPRLSSQNWIFGLSMNLSTLTPNNWTTYAIGASSIDGLNCLQWSTVGAINSVNNLPAFLMPTKLINSRVYGKTQFCQCTMLQRSVTTGGIFAGVGVCLAPNYTDVGTNAGTGLFGYYLVVNASNGAAVLRRGGHQAGGEAGETTIRSYGAGTFVNADVIRLSADLSSSTQVTLIVTQNAVQLSSDVDAATIQIRVGTPGLVNIAPSVGTLKSEWRTFSAGIGL